MRHLLIIILFISTISYGQTGNANGDILKNKTLKEGVYANFKEFRANSPSIIGKMEFKESSEEARMLIGVNKNKLFIIDSLGNRKRLKRDIWGFSNGEDVYIFWDQGASVYRYFNKLITLDRFCYFLDDGYNSGGGSVNGVGFMVPNKFEIEYVLNINGGKTFKLNKKIMRMLLQKDAELLDKYNSDKKKRSNRKQYILDYCERNNNEVEAI